MARRAAARSLRPRQPNRRSNDKNRHLSVQALERREMLVGELGPQLISVAANSGENFRLLQSNVLTESPTQLTFRFDGSQQIDPATLASITIERSGGDGIFGANPSGVNNDVEITPGFLGFGDSQRIVIARFAETLPDDQYRIRIAGFDDTNAGIVGLRNTNGQLFDALSPASSIRPEQVINFQVEIGPQVVAIVPQPITGFGTSRVQQRSQIQVYFNNDPLSNPALGVINTASAPGVSVVNPNFYNLFFTNETVENIGDVRFRPTSVSYDPSLNLATLEFGTDLALLAPANANGGSGTYRLRVGSSQDLPGAPIQIAESVVDAGNLFSSSRNLGTSFNTSASVVVSGQVEPVIGNTIRWPGVDAPGVRDDRRDAQVVGRADTTDGINTFYYNFADLYGEDAGGNNLENAITPSQKQRAREILSLYAQHLGVEFIETENRGLQIVTGDLRALVEGATTGAGAPFQEYRVNDLDPTQGVLILDASENWFDDYGLSPDSRPSWFVEALRGIGNLLGLGPTFEQVPGVASGSNPALYDASQFGVTGPFSIEPDFLSSSDIIPLQALHRPEIRDVDLYRFDVNAAGKISIETFAQRLDATSSLNTDIKLWKRNVVTGQHELVARNDDFYSLDSFIGVDVTPNADGSPAEYFIGITASGNEEYNPNIAGSGGDGRSQGTYQMRITFQNNANPTQTIRDTDGSLLDGDADGIVGGDFNFWFRTAKTKATATGNESRTLFVDKSGSNATTSGDLATPYRTINYAFSQARPGDIVRILPNSGSDGLLRTSTNNQVYEIASVGTPASDGTTFNVPSGVTVMVDAGAIFKLSSAKISVGSERIDEDRSLASLQILGVPILVDSDGTRVSGEVSFTSYNDETIGVDKTIASTVGGPGEWAGIEFRNDFDYSEGRPVRETEGIFLDYVSHANIRFGGGSISATQPTVTPIQMLESRPTLIYNTIRNSRDAAISADPNSFLETNFHAPIFQRAASFTSDYDRVGPDIRGNRLIENSINGLFISVQTPAVGEREPMTVSGRFNDYDIVHALSEVLVLQGQPGGSLLLEQRPDVLSTIVSQPGAPLPTVGTLTVGEVINYRVTFVNADGSESLASLPTSSVTVGANRNVQLQNLPAASVEFTGRRLYRLVPSTGNYVFVAQLDRGSLDYLDTGKTRGGLLPASALALASNDRLLPRYDARLSIDPGIVVKLDSARIEARFGSDFYAEGTDGNPVVFTSRLDDTYGAGGTFDTNNDGTTGIPVAGSWAGLIFRQGSTASLDYNVIRYAGGTSAVGGNFATFNPVEILQADVRIANSLFSNNAAGSTGGFDVRDSAGFNGPATIFVRGAQPIIVDNIIRNNAGAAISINPDALNYVELKDVGRSTGDVDRYVGDNDNQGPLVAGNRLDANGINGMLVRNESLTTESVWDDTDIVHVVENRVNAYNQHHRGGLRLKSDANQSLVVKVQTGGSLHASQYATDVEDSIGGTIQVLGQPGFPVVLTSINDCEVGAGFTPDGLPQNDTIESGACSAVSGAPGVVDIMILLDDTGSFSIAGATLASVFPQLVTQLGLSLQGTSFAFGISRFEDYSETAFGLQDRPFILNQPIISTSTTDFDLAIDAALNRTSPGSGGDAPESAIEALWQIATGVGFDGNGDGDTVDSGIAGLVATQTTPGAGGDVPAFSSFTPDPTGPVLPATGTLGGVGWRANANQKIVILATDIFFKYENDGLTQYTGINGVTVPAAEFTASGSFVTPGGRGATIQATIDRLIADNIKVIGLGTGAIPQRPLEALATLTGATDSAGNPLFFTIQPGNAALISDGIVNAITQTVAAKASAGDWQGIVIEAGANDRNVAFIPENEQAIPTASNVNAIPGSSQVLGSLARSEVTADENRRLGFNVRGALSQNSDLDVYKFLANGGTEVYLDIDDTGFGLDTVVELIDVNGNILALSDSSETESGTPSQLFRGTTMPVGSVMPLYKTGKKVIENPNALDAGMRVILPGNSATVNEYYVRVRSSNLRPGDAASRLSDPNSVGLGLSSGQYQLSLRLRETDEIAGTTVRLADIRYATTAIDIPAAPNNSPLAGEHAEEIGPNGFDVNNDPQNVSLAQIFGGNATVSFTNGVADPLGSLSQSDRGVLRVSGELGNQVAATNITPDYPKELDIDVFRVEIRANIQATDINDENRFVSTIFDVDYADQFGGPNTSLAVYDAAGRLILHSRDSGVADDQGRPTLGNDPTNLPSGSAGTLDAYIGPVELQEGIYYVVVSSAQMIPSPLNQLFDETPLATGVRILPIDSTRRLAEFGFDETLVIVDGAPVFVDDFESVSLNTAADLPTVRPLFDGNSIVSYRLEDVRLFVSVAQAISGNNGTSLISVDPFTGALERTIGQFGPSTGDLAIRRDGQLFAYSFPPNNANNGNTGNFLNVSSADGSAANVGDDGITFQRNNAAGTGLEADDNALFLINAISFSPQQGNGITPGNGPTIQQGERALVVGNRPGTGRGEIPFALTQNILYSMEADNGAATNRGSTAANTDRNFGTGPYREPLGASSNKFELGVIDTGLFPDSPLDPATGLPINGGTITGIATAADDLAATPSKVYGVTDRGYVYTINPTSIRSVDVEPDVFPPVPNGPADGSAFFVVNTVNNGRIQPHPDDFNSTSTGFVRFASLTLGPKFTELDPTTGLGRYADVLFGVTAQGWIYTMTVDPATNRVEPAPVLANGEYAVQITDSSGTQFQPVGAAFSTREQNLFHTTSDFASPFGNPDPNAHGVFIGHNQTRIRTAGGSSLYFGNEIDGNANNNTLDGGNGVLNPGGASGTTVSAPFSLEGYASSDKPTLYFTYLLETQADRDYQPPAPPNPAQTDSFRVFAAGDDGQWRLLATNNSHRSFSNLPNGVIGGDNVLRGDEYDYFATTGIPVQELFENDPGTNSTNWRQARVDLSPLAGDKNVQLRFDFSTAGGMQSRFLINGYLTELQATSGTDVVDGSTFTLTDSNTSNQEMFQYVRGAAIAIPSGNAILDGQQISFVNAAGVTRTLTLTTDPQNPVANRVLFTRTASSATIAASVVTTLNQLDPTFFAVANGGNVLVPEAASFALSPERFGAASIAIPTPSAALVGQSLRVTNQVGVTTTVTLQTTQQVVIGNGVEQITVTSDVPGFADGVSIVYESQLGFGAAFATYDSVRRVVKVVYDPLVPTSSDYNAIAAAIDALADFSAAVTAGVGTTEFKTALGVQPPSVVFSATNVYFDPAGTANELAQAIVTKLNGTFDFFGNVVVVGLDPSLGATVVGNSVLLTGATSVPITVPANVATLNGQSLSFLNSVGNSTTVTLTTSPATGPNDVFFTVLDSPTLVAQRIVTRLSSLDASLGATRIGDKVSVPGARGYSVGPSFTAGTINATSFNAGATAAQFLANGNVPIFYNERMTAVEVRDAIRAGLAAGLGNATAVRGVSQATLDNYPTYGSNRIRLYNQQLSGNTSTTGVSSYLPGDEFGSEGSSGFFGTANINTRPATNNDIQGVYIDDIVIGFAERGEVVYNAPPDSRDFEVLPEVRSETFGDTQQPERIDETLVGNYTLEIRTGAEYGVPEDYDPIRLQLNEQFGLGRSFDTNDRLSGEGVTLIAPRGTDLVDGDVFVLSNGSRQVTFEFDSNNSVQTGRVRVPFTPPGTGPTYSRITDEGEAVATAIRNAINSAQAFNLLGIYAAGRDGSETGLQTDNRIELFGKSIQLNPTTGRFSKIDLVAEETFYGREGARSFPAVDHDAQTVTDVIAPNSFARATTTNFVNGLTDTLVAVGKIGDNVLTRDGGGTINYVDLNFNASFVVDQTINNAGNVLLPLTPIVDVDLVKIYLRAGDVIDVDVDTVGWNLGTEFGSPKVDIYGVVPGFASPQLQSSATGNAAPGEINVGAFINNFVAPRSGYYYVAVGTTVFSGLATYGEYQLSIRPGNVTSNSTAIPRDVLMVDYHLDKGDTNVFRDQGQYIIESNFIRDYATTGILASFGNPQDDNDANFTSTPLDRRPGAAATLRNPNTQRLIPGTVISNNLLVSDFGSGIVFSGESAAANDSPAPVPFGRIVNNTIVGSGAGVGLSVAQSASPTVLNNIITGFSTGLSVSADSSSTIEGGNAYQNNDTDSNRPLATSSIVIADNLALFQDANSRIYIPAELSAVIDSSFASLQDRTTFVNTVKSPVGISASPIIAPIFDAYGIPRVDDPQVTTPSGVGSNVFIDRGAIDRADDKRPTAVLVNPADFILGQGVMVPLGDDDPDASFVRLPEDSPGVSFFEVQLLDPAGSGPNPATITPESVILTQDGVRLTPSIDYIFGYSSNSRVIRLTPTAGLWRPDSVYEITLNNQDRVRLNLPAGDGINDGDQYIITDSAGRRSVFEFDSGFGLQVPRTLGFEITGANNAFNDRDTFTITAPSGTAQTFEINRTGGVTSGNIAINLETAGTNLQPAGTVQEVRDAILDVLSTPAVVAALDLAPRAFGAESLQIGSLAGHTITTSSGFAGLTVIGVADGVVAGDQFTYQTSANSVLFEFTAGGPATNPLAVAIPIDRTNTNDEIATQIAAALVSQSLGLSTARALSDGRVLVGGATTDSLTLVNTALQLIGSPGVAGGLTLTVPTTTSAASLEGLTFSVTNGSQTETFIFTQNSGLATTARRILLPPAPTPAQIATLMVAAIDFAFADSLDPVAVGNVVTLGEQPAIISVGETQVLASVNVGTSPLVLDGVSGGSIPVDFIPSSLFTPASAAASLEAAVATSPLASTTFSPGGGTLLFDNTQLIQLVPSGGVAGTIGFDVPANADLATNKLASNRSNGETRFTVIMPEVRFDFGDAPVSYKTLLADNGARHTVGITATPRLGSIINTELDGQPSPASDDDGVAIGTFNDGVTSYTVFLAPGAPSFTTDSSQVLGFLNPQDPLGSNVSVRATGAGLLDAWIDFDGSGVFDADEQVLTNTPVVNGVNTVRVFTPAGVTNKSTWARFRLSSGGNVGPTGVAVGGEVEDYQVQIISIPLPTPVDDPFFSVDEDNVLDTTTNLALPSLTDNDIVPGGTFLPVRIFVGQQPANGTVVITNSTTGRFIYTPNPGFIGVDTFTYRLSNQSNAGAGASAGITFATVTINVTNVNDPPTFSSPATVDISERDDSLATVVPFASNVFPAPPTAVGERSRQTVSFQILTGLSTVPNGLMLDAPQIAADGTLTIFPAPDAVGTAVYVFEAVDAESGNAGFVPQRTRGTVTINVRSVNDPPRPNPNVVNRSQVQSADEAWSVDALGTVTYTLKEDNTGAGGATSPYIINLRRDPSVIGYQRIGLLDTFSVGPASEETALDGGPQVLSLQSFQGTTALNGTVRVRPGSNGTQLEYIPPVDFNTSDGLDSFTFIVQDDNPNGGETFNLGTGTFVNDQKTSTGTVQFLLTPVNDPPRFNITSPVVSVLEDTGLIGFEDFVTGIFAGPPNTAFDEIDLNSGQQVTFAVTAVSDIAGLFATPPTVDSTGRLSFATAANAYGQAVFEVRATDSGTDNATRGDIVSSPPRLITINIRPVNDRPAVNSTTPIVYTLNEDAAVVGTDGTTVTNQGTLIPLRGTNGQVGLLDVFNVGPANEAANINPGGNQSIRLSTPIPAGTLNGGILSRELDSLGNLIGLRYSPRANFNGIDSFVYGVIDNGKSSDLGGIETNDFREGFTTVSLEVISRNDAPTFGGAPSVTVVEDATTTSTVGQTVVPNWATNIQAGPAGASDELDPVSGQAVIFTVNPVGNPTSLFSVTPRVSPTGTLSFTTAPNANGVAVFTIVASDNGSGTAPLDFNTSNPPRTFTIAVNPVNDPPTFTAGANIAVDEDSGQFNSPVPYASNVSPGPADEVAAGQTVLFSATVRPSDTSLFAPNGLPTITTVTNPETGVTSGFLRFTPATNVSGVAVVTVVAIDSAGGRSPDATLTISIGEVNDVPVANNDNFIGNEDTAQTITRAQLLANDIDPDINSNPVETLTIIGLPSLSASGASIRVGTNGDIEYDPSAAALLQVLAPGQTRLDTFTYRLRDAAGRTSNPATVTISVTGVNDAPLLLPDTPTLAPTGQTLIRPLDNDIDIDGTINPATLTITLQPAFGSLVVQTDGTLIYTPFENFRGQDTVRYTVADNLGAVSQEQTITIDVNEAPIAVKDSSGTFRDQSVDINVATNDSDPDGTLDLNSIEIITPPVRGTATVAGGGIVRFLPEPGFIGNDSFEYTIRDNAGRASNVAKVSIQTVGSQLQNPRDFTDVNASGQTSPLDALLIINFLSRAARNGQGGSIPVRPTDRGPNFYDTDGNLVITANDALRVINQLARNSRLGRNAGAGEAAPAPQTNNVPLTAAAMADTVVATFDDKDYQIDFSTPSDNVVTAIAIQSEESKDQRESQYVEAIDAAWADVMND